jgi:hypothetical protein
MSRDYRSCRSTESYRRAANEEDIQCGRVFVLNICPALRSVSHSLKCTSARISSSEASAGSGRGSPWLSACKRVIESTDLDDIGA